MIKEHLKIIGKTSDNRYVVAGVYKFHETVGLPISLLVEKILTKNLVISWYDFYLECKKAKCKRIFYKIEEALWDNRKISDKDIGYSLEEIRKILERVKALI